MDLKYIGSSACTTCHKEIADGFKRSGHPYKLTKVVDGKPPTRPFSEVPNPPTGYRWNDITYVIGGYGWKARFLDKNGYIITGPDAKYQNQYNLPNATLGKEAGWAGYHPGEQNLKYDCGACHTTGYQPEGHQDGLPGIVGTWTEAGIGCEACHGAGSSHRDFPETVDMLVDRSSEACGACHSRDAVEVIDSSGGFIQHHEQYEELLQTQHNSLSCVACHDPHKGVIQGLKTNTSTVRVECQSCHVQQARFQKAAEKHEKVACIECHMPRIDKSAWGDAKAYTGDIRSHLFAIDPYSTSQFSADGKRAVSEATLDFACKSCHRAGGTAEVKTDEVLKTLAIGYHERR